SEIGLMVPGAPAAVDDLYRAWAAKGARVVEEPHDGVFGRTFVVADPDGNLIRVSPIG
ncbi:glyoxalase, partial [Rhizobium leguminosarum]|nr:glyoxalase [Rhizobium leguminosarum]